MPIREVNVNRQIITLKGRVIEKSRTLQTLKNDLKFFHIDLIDRDGDTIKVKFWRNKAEEYYNKIEQGDVYIFKCTGSDVAVSNARFNNTSNPYEINFSERCKITKVEHDETISKDPQYRFLSIKDIRNMNTPCTVDIIGIIKSFSPLSKVISRRNNEEIPRRNIVIVDNSEYQLNVTLWGDLASIDDEILSDNPVVAFKNLQIRDFQGKQGSTINGRSMIDFKLKNDRMNKVKSWFIEYGQTTKFQSINTTAIQSNNFPIDKLTLEKSLKEVRILMDENSYSSNQTYSVLARISRIGFPNSIGQNISEKKPSLTYDACPKCKKKVLNNSYCEKCDESVIADTKYMFPVTIEDYTSSLSVRCFHNIGSIVLSGLESSECKQMELRNDVKLNFLLGFKYLWQYLNLRITLRMEEYNNQKKTQAIIQSAEIIDFDLITNKMLMNLKNKLGISIKRDSPFEYLDHNVTKKPFHSLSEIF
ncbi:OB-fold nucleic acid binding domain-containing protein [Cryptosporidium andersoni]|uniref:OB-fold nucleic acid binding domain-containing protein n=1 Tax=Cryptosporidium andersoni TaxID=117008 RepID=A0A1J4MUQ1_9CRYT|nr:OB-fold nucleic acid binding domain-containing protein [Cryptosporidium andersoni]